MSNANVCPYPRGQAPTWRTTKREGYRECRSVPGMLGTAQTRERLPGQTQRTAGNAPCMTIFCAWRGSEGCSPRCCLPHPATRAAGPEALCVSPPVPQAQGKWVRRKRHRGQAFPPHKREPLPRESSPLCRRSGADAAGTAVASALYKHLQRCSAHRPADAGAVAYCNSPADFTFTRQVFPG